LDPSLESRLIEEARRVSRSAYCPYSRFPVGAAVLSAGGGIYAGCNVENASYGLTVCAERCAVFRMIAAGEKDIAAVAIYTPTAAPTAPCGACRQVINEFGPEAWIICVCDSQENIRERLGTLMPNAFGPKNMPNAGPG
jgi:cytidine deaminase